MWALLSLKRNTLLFFPVSPPFPAERRFYLEISVANCTFNKLDFGRVFTSEEVAIESSQRREFAVMRNVILMYTV